MSGKDDSSFPIKNVPFENVIKCTDKKCSHDIEGKVCEHRLEKRERRRYHKWLKNLTSKFDVKSLKRSNEISLKNSGELFNQNLLSIFEGNNTLTCSIIDDICVRDLLLTKSIDDAEYSDSIFVDKLSVNQMNKILHHPDAVRSLSIENAGGNSAFSEALSMQYFNWRFNARDFICEMEVEYNFEYKMIDFICSIGSDKRIGVSVSRAVGFPSNKYFTIESARTLLNKKLYGLIVARNSVIKKQTFFKSVLHIFCASESIASLLKEAYEELDIDDFGLSVKGHLITILTICDNKSIYFD